MKFSEAKQLPGECIKEPGPLGLWKGDPHARHEGAVQDHCTNLIAGGQVHCRDSTNTLPVKDDVLRRDS